ncbi:Alcohol dehydrogenase [Alphaproteobacteria bacterium SO-S41]|nr:Alcohol dehydrogenase [Alphaproteobacteria bacterium SO-S41]
MKTYRFDALTGLDDLTLHDEAVPVPQRGEVLVRIHAVSLNYRDLSVVLGNYVHAAATGLVPCSDAAGEIAAVGEGVTAWKPGDRVISTFHPRWFGGRPHRSLGAEVYGSGQDGWLSEYKVCSQEAIVALGKGVSYEAGSTLPCAATTAWSALSGNPPIRAGQTVLTLGTGGVSVFAVQLAKLLGATVIATTSSARKGEILRGLGADHVVNYAEIAEWGVHVKKALTGGMGVDCVVEVGGPGTVNQSLHAVRWGGEVVLIGFLTTENPGIDYFHLKGSGATVRAIGVGDRAALQDLVRAVDGGRLQPVIDKVFGFADAKAAFAHLHAAKHVGKIVIKVGG